MKTSKLWIWSFVFALCATGVLYFVIKSGGGSQAASTIPQTKESPEENKKSEPPKETAVQSEEEDNKENKLLPYGEGKRAISLEVTEVQGVSGFIRAGSHVDVVAILKVPEDAKGKQHDAGTLIIQNARVLAIGHAADDQEQRKRYQLVTLEVSSREGLVLGFSTKYELYLMLRTDGDNKLDPNHTHVHEDELHEGVFLK